MSSENSDNELNYIPRLIIQTEYAQGGLKRVKEFKESFVEEKNKLLNENAVLKESGKISDMDKVKENETKISDADWYLRNIVEFLEKEGREAEAKEQKKKINISGGKSSSRKSSKSSLRKSSKKSSKSSSRKSSKSSSKKSSKKSSKGSSKN